MLDHGSLLFLTDNIRCNTLTLYAINHGKTLDKTNAFNNG